MTNIIPFTQNYQDLSNERGQQFEFYCERCGNGYRSPFETDKIAAGKGLLRGLSRLTGGALDSIASASDELLDRNTNSPAKDKALREAVDSVRDYFRQCRACSNWVCVDVCWNNDIGQCLNCSPNVTDELSRAQAAAQVEQINEKVREQNWTSELDQTTRARVQCPSCNAPVEGGKFCGNCGGALQSTKHCTNCGSELKDGVKFCGECGQKA